MPSVESFEVQGKQYLQTEDKISLINQIAEELIPKNASYGFTVKFHNEDQMTVTYQSTEIDLQHRFKEVEEQANKYLSEWEKYIKKEFKSRGGGTLKLKEKKDLRQAGHQRVSINARYHISYSRTYEIG